MKWENFKQKCKQAGSSRAVYVTVITLLLALAVLITATAISNRAKKANKDKLPPDSGNTPGEFEDNKGGNLPGPDNKDEQPSTPSDTDKPSTPSEQTPPSDSASSGNVPELSLPVSGSVSKGHDTSIQVFSATTGDYRIHLGVDMSTETDAPVAAAADGVVSQIWDDPLMGKCLAISHSGDCYTIYKNLSVQLPDGIAVGAAVSAGQQIGTVGETATLELAEEPHLHMEMTVKGLAVDPMEYFSAQALAAIGSGTEQENAE